MIKWEGFQEVLSLLQEIVKGQEQEVADRDETKLFLFSIVVDIGPIMVMLGIIYPVASMIAFICREKELRQKHFAELEPADRQELQTT